MRNFIGFIILLLAGILQISFLPHLTVLNIVPNLVLALLIIWAFSRPPEQSIIWAIMGGLILDIFSASTFGIFTLLCILITFLVSFVKKNFIGDVNFIFKISIAFFGFLFFNLMYFLINKLFVLIHLESISLNTTDYLLKITPLEIFYSLIIFIILVKPLEKINAWISHYEYTSKVPTKVK
ncbi:rod shape-determining protein MreD [Patescibacteria group bacterium]